MPTKSINPKEHPTFLRAMSLARKGLVEDKAKLTARAQELLAEGLPNRSEATAAALSELAQAAYEEVVDTLSLECSWRARIEYTLPGEEFAAQARRHAQAQGGEAAEGMAAAFEQAQGFMPESIRTIHEFGLREDGLIFGRTHHKAIGGNFAMLQRAFLAVLESEARRGARPQSEVDDEHDDLAEWVASGLRPGLAALARRAFPDDQQAMQGRPLCTHLDELAARVRRLESIVFSAGDEARHALSGAQVAERLAGVARLAHAERPGAKSISQFFLALGH